jgi:hypothetical protein
MRPFNRAHRIYILLASLVAGGAILLLTAQPSRADPSLFDWDVNNWPRGSLMEVYPGIGVPATVFTITFSGNTELIEDGLPESTPNLTGGITPPEDSLFFSALFTSFTETITITFELSNVAFNTLFQVFDVDDPNSGNGVDRVAISAVDFQGQTVMPTLTAFNPACVEIIGNVATGECFVASDSPNGNVTVEFPGGIAEFTIAYTDAQLGANPDAHGIAVYDIYFEPGFPVPTPTITLTPIFSPTPTATQTPMPHPTETLTPTPTLTPGPLDEELYLPSILKQQ